MRICIGIVSVLLVITNNVRADVHYVDSSRPSGGDGSSWDAALRSLCDALDVAVSGDEIWVAAGRYTPRSTGSNPAESFVIGDGVAVFGGFRGDEAVRGDRDPTVHRVILTGDVAGDDAMGRYEDNSDHVVILDDVGTSTVLDGLTITGGHARPTSLSPHGGGVWIRDARPQLRSVVVRGNRTSDGLELLGGAGFGAGIAIEGRSEVTLTDCVIEANVCGDGYADSTPLGLSSPGGSGGGIAVWDGTLTLDRCRVEDNVAGTGGAGTQPGNGGAGGGLFMSSGWLIANDSTFLGNAAGHGGDSSAFGVGLGGDGGGICSRMSAVDLHGCTLAENITGRAGRANLPATSGSGGGISVESGRVFLRECSILDNQTAPGASGSRESGGSGDGGGLAFRDVSTPTLVRCRVAGNRTGSIELGFIVGGHAGSGGGVHALGGDALTLIHCELVGNSTASGGVATEYLGGDAGNGGGVAALLIDVTMAGCVIAWNLSGDGGAAGIVEGGSGGSGAGGYFWMSDADITQSTIANNTAGGGGDGSAFGDPGFGGGLCFDGIAGQVSNSVLAANADAAGTSLFESQVFGPAAFEFSCVSGWDGGSGAFDADPLFHDPDGVDQTPGTDDDRFDLASDSPLIDAGSNELLVNDDWDLDGNSEVDEPVGVDLFGFARRVDDILVPDSGVGEAPVVDIGAFEWQPPCVVPIATTPPVRLQLCPEEVATLWADVVGTAPVEFQWYEDGVLIVGAVEASLPDVAAAKRGSTIYSVEVTNACGSIVHDVATVSTAPLSECGPQFIRGDGNADGALSLVDIVVLLQFVLQGTQVGCPASLDTDDDGTLTIADAIFLASYIYLGESAPGEPYPLCGVDPTSTPLACVEFAGCP